MRLNWTQMPLIKGVRELAAQGHVTGASGRNWDSYGQDVSLPADFPAADKALLSDPQTSGGLLVSCSADSAGAVLAIFHAEGFADAAVVGEVTAGRGVVVYQS